MVLSGGKRNGVVIRDGDWLLANQVPVFPDSVGPHTEYIVKVAAKTEAGQGNFSERQNPIWTDEEAPESSISDLTGRPTNTTTIELTWGPPALANGKLTKFTFRLIEAGNTEFSRTVREADARVAGSNSYKYPISGLKVNNVSPDVSKPGQITVNLKSVIPASLQKPGIKVKVLLVRMENSVERRRRRTVDGGVVAYEGGASDTVILTGDQLTEGGSFAIRVNPCIQNPAKVFKKYRKIPHSQEPTDTSKQPIRPRDLGHVTGYQPISDQYLPFLRFYYQPCFRFVLLSPSGDVLYTSPLTAPVTVEKFNDAAITDNDNPKKYVCLSLTFLNDQ
eukprot:sb/3466587/